MSYRIFNLVQSESNVCWFLFVPTLPIKNKKKKREAASEKEAGGDEKHLYFCFTWPNMAKRQSTSALKFCSPALPINKKRGREKKQTNKEAWEKKRIKQICINRKQIVPA